MDKDLAIVKTEKKDDSPKKKSRFFKDPYAKVEF